MNIEELSRNTSVAAARKQAPVGTSSDAGAARDTAQLRDSVDMSMIGRIMAKSVKNLADSEQPRAAKIEQFSHFVEQSVRFPNNAIDKVISRMAGR